MEYLPLELFENIFGNITDIEDLLHIRAINRFYYAIFTPRAFREIAFQNRSASPKRFANIASSRIARWVEEISFTMFVGDHCDAKRYPIAAPEHDEHSISAFTNLQRISVHFPGPHKCRECHLGFQDMMLNFLIGNQSAISLTLTNLKPTDAVHNNIRHPEFQRLLSRLTHLSVEFSGWTPQPKAAETSLLEDFLRPTQDNLETLVLRSPSWVPEFPVNLTFSKLKKLELQRFILSGPKHAIAETFIMSESVAASLKEMHLSHIAICSEKKTGSSAQASSNSTWAGILLAFQKRLKGLKRFGVEEGLGYMEVDVDDDSGYRSIIPQRHDLLADQKALNALWESIGQEKRVKFEEYILW